MRSWVAWCFMETFTLLVMSKILTVSVKIDGRQQYEETRSLENRRPCTRIKDKRGILSAVPSWKTCEAGWHCALWISTSIYILLSDLSSLYVCYSTHQRTAPTGARWHLFKGHMILYRPIGLKGAAFESRKQSQGTLCTSLLACMHAAIDIIVRGIGNASSARDDVINHPYCGCAPRSSIIHGETAGVRP